MGICHGVTILSTTNLRRPLALVIALCFATFCSTTALADGQDPLEGPNRTIHSVNYFADKKLIMPIARTYVKVIPEPARFSIGNFFGNLADLRDGVNNLLQGKPKAALNELGRILVNSTIGVGGLFDPASRMGLVDHYEDFSQTLGTWGVPRGPYLVIPLLGPSSVRDLVGRLVDFRIDPVRYYYPVSHRNMPIALRLVDQRAGLLIADKVVFGDRYIFYRDAYLQRRNYLENDGEIDDLFDDEF